MIKLYISELFLKKGIKPNFALMARYGINKHSARHLISGKAKSIKLDALYKLCLNMECGVEDIFDYVPSEHFILPEDHPLRKIYHPTAPISCADIIKDLPPDKLEKVLQYVLKVRKQ